MFNSNNYGYYNPQRYYPSYQQPNDLFNTVQRSSVLNGKQVDSMEVVKAIDIPLDGSVSYFPLVDGSAIITKQLQNDGTSKIVTYKPEKLEEKENIVYVTKELLDKEIDKIDLSEIDDFREELLAVKKELKELKKKRSE